MKYLGHGISGNEREHRLSFTDAELTEIVSNLPRELVIRLADTQAPGYSIPDVFFDKIMRTRPEREILPC